jgi:hypothetical protein
LTTFRLTHCFAYTLALPVPQDIALAAHSVPTYLQSREIAQQFDTDPIYLAGLHLLQATDFAACSELIQPGSEPDAISHDNEIRQAKK